MAGDSILSGIGDLTGDLVKIFDNGVAIYQGIDTRIDALKKIKEDTPAPSNTAVAAPNPIQEKTTEQKTAQTTNNISLLLIVAGAIGAILLVIVLKR